ncbi:MAG: hypothetical protein PWP24_756 [Clostridiales bacterium]|nr:hypothetical protein [Clostridiales bacterium]
MKKIIALFLGAMLSASVLAGCGAGNDAKDTADNQATPAPTESAATSDEGTTDVSGALKTGIAVTTSVADSTSAADEDGVAQVYSTIVAVLVDGNGTIVDCKIDAAQTKINFSKEGKITSDLNSPIQSKQEIGAAYGMAAKSGIGKEWNEQASAFAAYVVGKTADEVKGIAVNEEGIATDADLTSSVTIHIGDFMATVEKAVASAKELGANAGDKLGMAVNTDISGSKDASAEGEGLAQAYSYYSAVTTNADGAITSCIVDASQGSVNFDTTGTITTDLTAAQLTKQELKDAYGMKAKSEIGKEWYEQADAFSAYVTGKTADEVKGIAVSEEGKAKDADLISSVTVHIAPFIGVVEKAVASVQ